MIWHTHLFVDGQRFRKSLETSDWREAQKREKELVVRASQGKLAPLSQQFSKLTFREAGEKNLAERCAHLAPRSVQTERERLKPLCSGFGPVKMQRVTVDMVRTYVADRKAANVGYAVLHGECCAKVFWFVMVGARGFEPPTPWSRTRCSTRLSHAPTRRIRLTIGTAPAKDVSGRSA